MDDTPEPRKTSRLMLAFAAIALVAAHGLVLHLLFRHVFSHSAILMAVGAGLFALIVIKHLGWWGRNFRRC